MKIAFIGIGVMGLSMARNLMKNGHELCVYTRTREKALPLLDEGARWYDNPAQCVSDAAVVITMLGFPSDVRQVYFGQDGVIENALPGAYLIDMTTTDPALSIEIYEAAKKRGLYALDAPVSGGDSGAKAGTLSIMAGGDRQAFDDCMPVFMCMGKNIVYEGNAGSGQHTKMANQIAIAGALAGVCEALRYGETMGLDLQTMLDSISAGAAGSWQMSNTAPRILKGDYAPGFYTKHYIKDMRIAALSASKESITLPVLQQVLGMFEELSNKGCDDLGTQALMKHYRGE